VFPQELYFLWLILALLVLSLFFFTALGGRLWCGYACPQTVFTDVFAGLARRIQGWKGSRPPKRIAPWRTCALHATWLALAGVVAFHLVGYFRSPYSWLDVLSSAAPLPPIATGFLAVASLVAYLDFALLRQKFCKYLCPYARFQSVLFDRDTLVVAYDSARGEPRGKRGKVTGDCVDCGLCVAVCPSEIDIRNGLQLDCIACTQCIDACNGVMQHVGRAPDLIGYRSLAASAASDPKAPGTGSRAGIERWLRPRVVTYGALLGVVAVTFSLALVRREPMELTVSRNRSQLYSTAADGQVSNAFTLQIENRSRQDQTFRVRIAEEQYLLVAGLNPISIPAISHLETRVFVLEPPDAATSAEGRPSERTPQAAPAGTSSREIHFVLESVEDTRHRVTRRARFWSPASRTDLKRAPDRGELP